MVKIKKAEYVLSAAWKSQWPEESFPEMCLAGRSNVGKSSFINAMLNHNGLAKVSGTPGKTRTLNFFNVNDALYFVDVPGYGYAKVNDSITKQFGKTMDNSGSMARNSSPLAASPTTRHPAQCSSSPLSPLRKSERKQRKVKNEPTGSVRLVAQWNRFLAVRLRRKIYQS